MGKIAVVILHFGSIATTRNCLTELKKKIGQNILILINNDKQDITSLASIIPGTKLIQNKTNLGFAAGVNQGISLALKDKDVDSILLMNNDLTLSFGSLDHLRTTLYSDTKLGIVSPVLHHGQFFDWGGTLNKWTGNVRHKNWGNKPKTLLTVGHVAGCAMLIKRAVVEKIGQFDPRFFLYFEDLDFCLRVAAEGYTIAIDPQVVAEHEVSQGSHPFARTIYQWRSHAKFLLKYLPKHVYPTAILYHILFYPLVLLKISLKSLFIRAK